VTPLKPESGSCRRRDRDVYRVRSRGGIPPFPLSAAGIAGRVASLAVRAGRPRRHAIRAASDARYDLCSTSHWAGGMLAPWVRRPKLPSPVIGRLGPALSSNLWREHFSQTNPVQRLAGGGACTRTPAPISKRFAKLTTGHRRLDAQGLSELEPSLEGRFFATVCLFMPMKAMSSRARVLPETAMRADHPRPGGTIKFGSDADAADLDGIVIDCPRAIRAPTNRRSCAAFKGEMIIVETLRRVETVASRCRLIHPRWPLYVDPARATASSCWARPSIEAEDKRRQRALRRWSCSARAYAVHPAFCRSADFSNSAPACARPNPDKTCRRDPRWKKKEEIAVKRTLSPRVFLLAPAAGGN